MFQVRHGIRPLHAVPARQAHVIERLKQHRHVLERQIHTHPPGFVGVPAEAQEPGRARPKTRVLFMANRGNDAGLGRDDQIGPRIYRRAGLVMRAQKIDERRADAAKCDSIACCPCVSDD